MTSFSPWSGVRFLDCTLRDGGYYTAWDFEPALVEAYLTAMSRLDVDTVELGYCNMPRSGYSGQYAFLDARTVSRARGALRPDQHLGVMLDEKSVRPADARRLLGDLAESIDLVRIAVAPGRVYQAADLGEEIRALGLDVGINIMYLSRYWDDLSRVVGLERALDVSAAVSLVDSFGAVTPSQVSTAVAGLKERTASSSIGFHGHDNLGLAIANSLAAAEAGASIVDGTLTGMGRGPGNTRTELLLTQAGGGLPGAADYAALELAVAPFEVLRDRHGWGTNLVYMISGAAGLPQGQVMDWLGKNRYATSSILAALHGDADGNLDTNAYEALAPSAESSPTVLILGGGDSVRQHSAALVELATELSLTVIHANSRHFELISAFTDSQYLCVAGDALSKLITSHRLDGLSAVVVPTPPRFAGSVPTLAVDVRQVDPIVLPNDGGPLGPVSDVGPLALGLGTAVALGATRVLLAGFDGYEFATEAQQDLAAEVQQHLEEFTRRHPEIEVSSLTRTRYSLQVNSPYSMLTETRLR